MAACKQADEETRRLLETAREKWHEDLVDADVAIALLFTEGLKHKGWPAIAEVKIESQRSRVLGVDDATVTIDQDRWALLSMEQKLAVLDHELEHLVVETEENGDVSLDECSRPKLRIKDHDYQFGWFNKIAERHGKNAIEVQQATQLHEAHGQLYFAFLEHAPAKPADVIAALTSPEGMKQVERTMRRKGHKVQIALMPDAKPAEHDPKEDR